MFELRRDLDNEHYPYFIYDTYSRKIGGYNFNMDNYEEDSDVVWSLSIPHTLSEKIEVLITSSHSKEDIVEFIRTKLPVIEELVK